MKLKGTFTSVWDCGDVRITTPAELDTETGEVTTESVDVDDSDIYNLDREYFTDEEEVEYEVCMDCHTHIFKTVMKEDFDKLIFETLECCTNPDCDNNFS